MTYRNAARSAFGVATFGKAPLVELGEEWAADVAVLGVPFDQAVTYRPGTRFGPRAIRDMSVRYSFFARTDGSQPGGYWDMRTGIWRARCSVVDCGDTEVAPLGYEQCYDNVRNSVREIVSRGAVPFVLGGDHSITLPIVQALEGKGPITVVHFDAHTDYRDHVLGVRIGHAQVIRRVAELAAVKRVISLGIRAMRTDPADVRAFKSRGNVLIPAWDIHEHGADAYARVLPEGENVYVTFDIDAMDPSIAPGTGTLEVGGLRYEQARRLLELVCTRNRIVGFDLVEVNPMLDPSNITALLAAQVALEVIGFLFPGSAEKP